MTVSAEIQSLSPSSIIEMFILDTSTLGGDVYRFHAGTNGLQQPLVWKGETYMPLPIEAEGFDVSTQGTLPRPKLRVANIQGLFSNLVMEEGDLVGCAVTRKRTFARFLDAVNFPGGVNPSADPNQEFADDLYYIEQKTAETRYVVEWELSSAFDLIGIQLPRRQLIQNTCMWRYRGPECGYSFYAYFDQNDNPVDDPSRDVCGKRLSSCKCRFGNNPLPFGAMPGVIRNG